jgi:hypothetical protein
MRMRTGAAFRWEGLLGDYRASGELPQQLDGFEGSQRVIPEPA